MSVGVKLEPFTKITHFLSKMDETVSGGRVGTKAFRNIFEKAGHARNPRRMLAHTIHFHLTIPCLKEIHFEKPIYVHGTESLQYNVG